MDNIIYGIDGDQYTACREDFINLQESLCGFGYTNEEALKDLLRQEHESMSNQTSKKSGRFRVIDLQTGKEADIYAIVLESYKAKTWASNLVYCDIEGFAIEEDGTLVVLDECGSYAYPPQERFKVEAL